MLENIALGVLTVVNPFWGNKVTVFTSYYNNETRTTKWYKYYAENCFLKSKKIIQTEGNDIRYTLEWICRIPENETFLSYPEWIQETIKENFFHVNKGSIIVKGLVSDNIPDSDSGNKLLEKYKGNSFKVKSITENTDFMLKHYNLTGN